MSTTAFVATLMTGTVSVAELAVGDVMIVRPGAKVPPAVIAISLGSLAMSLVFGEQPRPVLDWGATFLPWVNPEHSPLMLGILSGVAVLVIACPCARGLATRPR